MQHTCVRWIFSPLETVPDDAKVIKEGFELPVARYYALQWRAPFHHKAAALVRCEMGSGQLAKAKQDTRLTILDPDEPVPNNVTQHHSDLGVAQGVTLRQMLKSMTKYHSCFEPE